MEHSFAQLMDLSDEIVMIILNKLDNVEVLYSLMNVSTRLNQIVQDSIFTTKITLMKSTDLTLTLPDAVLDRFCLKILPKIHHKIKWLNLESASMERILLVADYPNLRQLDIFINHEEPVLNLIDKSSLDRIFQNQIVTLSVTVELHINVYLFDDCLYLLDGRLNQLHTLFVHVFHIFSLRSTINNKEELTNLKYFSLRSTSETSVYDEVLVPHLHRMSNLETLAFHMPKLNEFIFNIRSIIPLNNQTHLLSNEDIHRTLTNLTDHQVISCVDYFPSELFKCVQSVTLFDERPFEHTFFMQIAQAFPFLKELT
ncbi:unnamed protein product, partial [Rotaria sordida]